MISVEEALARLLAPLEALPPEQVSVSDAVGRVLAEDVAARRTQPPFAVSAMDGYAVRADDVAKVPASLRIIAEIPAGAGYGGTIGAGEAARIFTGAPLPAGADAIVIQEDTERDGDQVEIREGAPKGRYVRRAGLDFAEGDVLLRADRRRMRKTGAPDRTAPDRQLERAGARRLRHGLRRAPDPGRQRARRSRRAAPYRDGGAGSRSGRNDRRRPGPRAGS